MSFVVGLLGALKSVWLVSNEVPAVKIHVQIALPRLYRLSEQGGCLSQRSTFRQGPQCELIIFRRHQLVINYFKQSFQMLPAKKLTSPY